MMKLTRIASAATLLCLSAVAVAQNAAPAAPGAQQRLEKITITGSSIKRLADEKAMPIEVITATDIRQMGLNSVDQIIDNLAANVSGATNQVTNNAVFGGDGEKTFGGANFANLRGLGANGTLVLLNGRRVSTHGMSGGAVDLNTIPTDAIERVEVLKDGASAIYGTDAIGGVINFITRTSYQGLSLRGNYSTPEASGGGQTARLTGAAGWGDLDRDGFNLMATLTVDNTRILRGTDRDWATGYQPERLLTPDSTSAIHANIIAQANTALTSTGTTVGTSGDTTRYTNLNLLAIRGECEAIPNQVPLAPNIQIWDLFGYTKANSQYRCTRDYGRNYMLRQPQDAINGMLTGTLKVGDGHRASIEVLSSQVKNRGEYSPAQISAGNTTTTVNGVTTTSNTLLYPTSPYYLNMRELVNAAQFDPTKPIAYRVNFLNDLGLRIRENETKNLRVQTALEGMIGGLDYSLGAGWGESKSTATLINGFPNTKKLVDLLASGKYNPFIMPGKTQTADVVQAFEAMQMRGKIYDGKTSVKQLDATLSGPLMENFLAGPLEFAVGANLREESYEFSGSRNFLCVDSITAATLATYDNAALTYGCPGNSSSPDLSRRIGAVFGELVVRPLQGLEVTLQARYDKYQVIGGTTNPKIGIKYQPIDTLLLRASANTGFRAPTPQQVRQGVVESQLTGQFRDPVLCADINNPTDPSQCARLSMPFRAGGNPALKPEESRQATAGFVFAPTRNFQATVDYWQVTMSDRIRSLSTAEMISNYDVYKDNFVRNPQGIVEYIQAGWVNSAGSKTKGVDFSLVQLFDAFDGRFKASVNGTKMISHKEQIRDNAPFVEYVGKWANTTLYLPWRVNASLGYSTGPWGVTLSGIYRDSYEDQNRGPTAAGGANYTSSQPYTRNVSAYSTFNLVTSYSGIKGLTITGSVINLADKQPPFTWHNIDSAAGAGWDPRVADPRGRTWGVSFSWAME